MELFEDGGLRDEGGMVDEESGNDVPVGSTRKEVRDDIPAMLSEGEFVFPADVVRYIGLENLMRIRQDAKQGLKQMDAMGQMGNGDEATMPDDLPFGMMDLVIVEGKEEPEVEKKAHGGVIHMNEGGFTTPSFTVPKFNPRNQDVRQYENADGKKLNIPFLGGKPVYPIPEGYFPVGSEVEEEKDETKEAIPTDDNDDRPVIKPSKFQEAGSWDMDTSAKDGIALDMWIKEAEKVSTYGNVAAGVMGAINPLLGGFVALANKNQKKQIIAKLDEKIAQAQKTPIKGQVAALREVKDRLTNPERKGVLAKVISEVAGAFGGMLGLSEEETKKAKVSGAVNAGQSTDESDDVTKKGIGTHTKAIEILGLTSEQIDSYDFGQALGTAVEKLGVSASADDLANAIAENYKATAPDMKFGPQTRGGKRREDTPEIEMESGPALSVETPSVEAQTEAAIPQDPDMPQLDASVVADQSPFKELFETPTIPKDPEAATPQMDVPSTLPLRTSIVSNRAKDLLSELRGSVEPSKVSSLLDQFTGTLSPSEDTPTAGDIESYLSRVGQESSQQPTPSSAPPSAPTTPTPSSGGDDDGPDFGDRDRPDFGGRDRDTGIKVKTDDVTIKGRTDSSGKKAGDAGYKSELKERKEKEKAIKEGQKAGKGYEGGYGFKKGGLASRKKKK